MLSVIPCVRIFGQALPGFGYRYSIQTCILCQAGSVIVSLKPPTAGYRILSIDRGGPRGVMPLEFIGLTQNLVCDCPVQDLFDGVWGTSSGMISYSFRVFSADAPPGDLIVLSLFLLG